MIYHYFFKKKRKRYRRQQTERGRNESKKAKQRQAYDYLYYVIRAAVLLSVVFLFIPSLNPARISGMINKNLSLFTSGISYSTLTNGFGRAFKKGWVSQESFMLDCAGAIVMCVGIASGVAAACMSLGNIRLKKLGNIFSLISGVVMTAGIVMISTAYKQISASEKVDKIEPMLPKSVTIMTAFAVILIISSIAAILLLKKQKSEKKFEMETKYTLFLMLMPFLALVAVFSYLPLWGWNASGAGIMRETGGRAGVCKVRVPVSVLQKPAGGAVGRDRECCYYLLTKEGLA